MLQLPLWRKIIRMHISPEAHLYN